MKVKDIERTANVAWSPKNQHPIYLAAGTAAQQLDASFNTSAALEIYSLNLTDPGPDMQLVSSLPSEHRFHKIIWGPYGNEQAHGTIIAGCEGGLIHIYNASKLLSGEEAIISKQEKHTGPVHALDFNSFQQNLFATGAGESEIFIWDLNNTTTPMSPGAKCQPLEDVLSVAWNKQVQHILASTFPSKCVIWDLRKNEPIIKLTDTVSRVRWKMVAWHPEVATQLCLASEEDHSPIIQLWDLRFATSPLKTLENHQRGVLSVAWCAEDSDLLVSCGKDSRIVCWNPNSNQPNGEVLSEIAKTNQWSFDIAWCPRNPALIACPNFDGHVTVYSLMGGKVPQVQTTNKIADSFPNMDGYVQAPVPQPSTAPVSVDLSKPPKWLKKPVGASFGFGGKLITFENDKAAIAQAVQNSQPGEPAVQIHRTVQISLVVTEPELVQKSAELEKALEYGNFIEYCFNKSEITNDQHRKFIWHFLKANFEQNPRAELLNLLGYRIEDVNSKLSQYVGKNVQNSIDGLTDDFSGMNRLEDYDSGDPFNNIAQKQQENVIEPFKIKTGDDTEGLITQALLLNNVEAAVELCLNAKRFADALIIATTGGPDLLARTQHKYLEQSEGYISSLISAMVSEDWGSIINNCEVGSWKEALAAALTHASDEDLPLLCEQLGTRLELQSLSNPKLAQDAQLCYICSGNFDKLVSSWSGNAMNSTKDLQELVELVMFLQKAIERQGRQVQITGALADLLSHYSSLLASQGNLSTAVAYLGSSQNEKVASLRDRLHVALGQKPLYAQEIRQQQNRRGSQRQSFTNYPAPNNFNANNPFHSSQSQFAAPQQPFGVAPANQFNTGLPNPTVNAQPWQTQPAPPVSFGQPPQTFSPAPQVPPPTQPPRPTSVGSAHGAGGGLPSRKYLLDPSVTSNQYGGPLRNQFQPQPAASFPSGGYSANTPYNTAPASSASLNPLVPNPVPLASNPTFNPTPLAPNPISGTPAYGSTAPSTGWQGQQPPLERVAPAINAFSNAPSGWNDPPPPSSKTSRPQPKPEAPLSEPITHPLYGATPAQPFPTNGYGDINPPPNQPYNPTPLYPQNPPSMYQPQVPVNANYGQQTFNPGNFNQNAIPGMGQQQPVAPEPVKPETPQPIQKPPIPEEHVHMKTVFDELREQCSFAANNPQTKRKLEDVGRKLESLYDLLRENKLSPNTLSLLHHMVQLIQEGNYTGGLNVHTQLVSGPDFAQIASFMPGLKVLLQCALQLQVYIR
ncbi:hypothetical protein NQ315_016015 [Exocentrus adspersus]|uniref:Protein transport protein Sec31A n=1 Tax=Exocentrus adspersus TaxID=1586481 RepID=A0AAV8VLV8_9CUCU|nr:hypothetical protein NQ315_016015 [Exocentrus adspersus]